MFLNCGINSFPTIGSYLNIVNILVAFELVLRGKRGIKACKIIIRRSNLGLLVVNHRVMVHDLVRTLASVESIASLIGFFCLCIMTNQVSLAILKRDYRQILVVYNAYDALLSWMRNLSA